MEARSEGIRGKITTPPVFHFVRKRDVCLIRLLRAEFVLLLNCYFAPQMYTFVSRPVMVLADFCWSKGYDVAVVRGVSSIFEVAVRHYEPLQFQLCSDMTLGG